MRIDAITNNVYTDLRPQTKAADRPDITSFATALTNAVNDSNTASTTNTSTNSISSANSAKNSNGFQQTDFSNMSSQELHDWTNTQLRNGNMTLDESIPFMLMAMNIPVDGSLGNPDERVDYVQKARDGIQRALSDNNMDTLKKLQSALQIMQKYQGQTSGIDIRA